MNFKKLKTLKDKPRNYLQKSIFTFLKFIFTYKLFKSKLLISHAAVGEALRGLVQNPDRTRNGSGPF